jgi:hypothetical protein
MQQEFERIAAKQTERYAQLNALVQLRRDRDDLLRLENVFSDAQNRGGVDASDPRFVADFARLRVLRTRLGKGEFKDIDNRVKAKTQSIMKVAERLVQLKSKETNLLSQARSDIRKDIDLQRDWHAVNRDIIHSFERADSISPFESDEGPGASRPSLMAAAPVPSAIYMPAPTFRDERLLQYGPLPVEGEVGTEATPATTGLRRGNTPQPRDSDLHPQSGSASSSSAAAAGTAPPTGAPRRAGLLAQVSTEASPRPASARPGQMRGAPVRRQNFRTLSEAYGSTSSDQDQGLAPSGANGPG